ALADGLHYAYSCTNRSLAWATYWRSGTSALTNPTLAAGSPYTTLFRSIIDKDGGFSEYTTDVSVQNVAPTATFNAPASVNEGSDISLSLTGAKIGRASCRESG